MKLDRNHMAAGLFTNIMVTANGIGEASPEERKAIYIQVADLCFEMADTFIEHAENSK